MGRKKNSDKVKEQSETQENIQLLVEDNNVEDNNVEDNNVEELLPDSPISEPLTEINLESDLKPVESDLKPVSDLEPVESDLKPVESDLESDLEPVLDLKQYFKPIKVSFCFKIVPSNFPSSIFAWKILLAFRFRVNLPSNFASANPGIPASKEEFDVPVISY